MNNPLIIRSAGKQDIAAIRDIYAHAVEHGTATFELEAPDEQEMLARFQATITGGYPYLVAAQNNCVKGYAHAGSFRPRPAYCWSVESTVYISPMAQGIGIGRVLLTRLIEECELAGFRQMLAIIGGGEHHASIGLHQALGFVKAGQMVAVGWKHGKWHDSVVMQRSLGEGSKTPPEVL